MHDLKFVPVAPNRMEACLNVLRVLDLEKRYHDDKEGHWYQSNRFSFAVRSDKFWILEFHVVSHSIDCIVLSMGEDEDTVIEDEIVGTIFLKHPSGETLEYMFGPKVCRDNDYELYELPIDVDIPLEICQANCWLQIEIPTSELDPDALPEDLSKFLFANDFSDVILEADQEKIPAHKLILSARSNVFRTMFNSNIQESPVKITDVDVAVLKEMLRYAYTGKVLDMEGLALDLMIAADKYNMKGLQKGCRISLIKTLNSEKAAKILIMADRLNDVLLKKVATDFIVKNLSQVRSSSEWSSLKEHPKIMDDLLEVISQMKYTSGKAKRARIY